MEDIKNKQNKTKLITKVFYNKYFLTIFLFIIWMIFLDNNSWLVIKDLNKEINKYEEQLNLYKKEFEKNNSFYKKLMQNKSEKEKFARENYFMKKNNEEIFILVADSSSTAITSQKEHK